MSAIRTTPANYHGSAVSWAEAAVFLCREGGDLFLPSRFVAPACFVTGHAWELALKVGIYAHGGDSTRLRKLGHNLISARDALPRHQKETFAEVTARGEAPDGTILSDGDMKAHFELLAAWHYDHDPDRPPGARRQHFDRYPAVLGAVQLPALLPLANACGTFLKAIDAECRRATIEQIEAEEEA